MKTGLVLEGGGMRGLYTSGVVDEMMDQALCPQYVIGVSAGANNGVSFVSGQRGRTRRINLDYIGDKRYMSMHSFVKTRSVFNMEFIFDEIVNNLDPFDYDAFISSPIAFVAGVTDVATGKSAYFDKSFIYHDSTVLKASSSIPIFSPPVKFMGGLYLDGGTSVPIPFEKAFEDGCERVIVVLTRDRTYVKGAESMRRVYSKLLRKYPQMIRALDERHEIYMQERRALFELEKQGRAIVIAPNTPLELSRFEKDRGKLEGAYEQGMNECRAVLAANARTLYDWGVLPEYK